MQKQTILILSLLFVIISSLTSCLEAEPSESVDQDRIFTNYEVFYNANEDITTAHATFHFGTGITGTPLELSEGSEVTFNGDVLVKHTEPITNLLMYKREYAGLVNEGTFVWTDLDGNVFENTISFKSIDYPADLTSIARDSSFEMFWQGDSLGYNEDVILVMNGDSEFDAQTFTQTATGATSIILAKNKLENMPAGEGDMWLDRRFLPTISEAPNAGGRILGRYRPDNLTVTLE